MKAMGVKILTHLDEEDNEWINIKPYIGQLGNVKEEGLTYFLLTMDDGTEIYAPKECVTVRVVMVDFSLANPEE